jgi:predicted nucleotidyltransferase
MQVELVIIGATAYRMFVDDPYRETLDVDVAVAVDLDDFRKLAARLNRCGWRQSDRQEHRWRGASGAIIDLIPAGVRLRAKKELVWPQSGVTMSLLGFDHVFREPVAQKLSSGLIVKVIPPHVFALLKIAAFQEGGQEREKDLRDIGGLLEKYEIASERRFGDEVYDSGLELHFDEAGSYLLGLDLGRLCAKQEAERVQAFLNLIADSESQAFTSLARSRRRFAEYNQQDQELKRQVQAFVKGFRRARQPA